MDICIYLVTNINMINQSHQSNEKNYQMTFSLSESYKNIEHILSFWSVEVEDINKNTHDKVMFIQMKPFLHDSLSCMSYCMQGLLYPLNTLAL